MYSRCLGSYTEVTTAHCTRFNIWQLCPYICLYTNAREPNLGGEAEAYNLSMNSEHFLILCWKSTAICWGTEYVPILFGSQGKRDLGCVVNTKIMQPLIQQCCYRRLASASSTWQRASESPKTLRFVVGFLGMHFILLQEGSMLFSYYAIWQWLSQ